MVHIAQGNLLSQAVNWWFHNFHVIQYYHACMSCWCVNILFYLRINIASKRVASLSDPSSPLSPPAPSPLACLDPIIGWRKSNCWGQKQCKCLKKMLANCANRQVHELGKQTLHRSIHVWPLPCYVWLFVLIRAPPILLRFSDSRLLRALDWFP